MPSDSVTSASTSEIVAPEAHAFELLATGQGLHFTVRLERADDRELGKLLAALGPARPNPQYVGTDVWREEG